MLLSLYKDKDYSTLTAQDTEGNCRNYCLIPPQILHAFRKPMSVLSSEVSLIGRGLLLTAVTPGRHTDHASACYRGASSCFPA